MLNQEQAIREFKDVSQSRYVNSSKETTAAYGKAFELLESEMPIEFAAAYDMLDYFEALNDMGVKGIDITVYGENSLRQSQLRVAEQRVALIDERISQRCAAISPDGLSFVGSDYAKASDRMREALMAIDKFNTYTTREIMSQLVVRAVDNVRFWGTFISPKIKE